MRACTNTHAMKEITACATCSRRRGWPTACRRDADRRRYLEGDGLPGRDGGRFDRVDLVALTDALISLFSVGRCTSERRLIYTHPLPHAWLPRRASRSSRPSNPGHRYRVMFCLRGDSAISIHSARRPLAPWQTWRPNPPMLPPHISGFAFVACCISVAIAWQSSRFCSSSIELKKASTESLLTFVFASAIISRDFRLASTR